jgi:uncharacterized repeat protein (TIGR03803 family)
LLTTLVSFTGTNGSSPYAGLSLGNDGAFYGSTYSGGNSNLGTVFRMTTDGTLTTLANFVGTNGAYPQADLALGQDGALYGTTYNGGIDDYGTVFCITTNGLLTTLVLFNSTNGSWSYTALAAGNNGAFYGTASDGGSLGSGNIFRLNPASLLLPPTRATDGWNLTVNGAPGGSYQIFRATNATGPWLSWTNVTPGADGIARWRDTSPLAGRAFYRALGP